MGTTQAPLDPGGPRMGSPLLALDPRSELPTQASQTKACPRVW